MGPSGGLKQEKGDQDRGRRGGGQSKRKRK